MSSWFTPPPDFSVGIERKWSELMLPGNDQDYSFNGNYQI